MNTSFEHSRFFEFTLLIDSSLLVHKSNEKYPTTYEALVLLFILFESEHRWIENSGIIVRSFDRYF